MIAARRPPLVSVVTLRLVAAVLVAGTLVGCAIVPQNRRARLSDPIMALEDDPLEARKDRKFYSTREAAAGGDGAAAGGGCGCQ